MTTLAEDLGLIQDFDTPDQLQLVDLWFPFVFGNSPYNRKDTNTLKLQINTGGQDVYVRIYTDASPVPIDCGTVNNAGLGEVFVDISNLLGASGRNKLWSLRLIGLVSDFKLSEVTIDYTDRPEPLTFINYPWNDLGGQKKRIRAWPITIDTNSDDVTIRLIVDGTFLPAQTFNTGYPKTVFYQVTSDIFGTDYALQIQATEAFELYKIHEPIGVQILPPPKRFDQVGSAELFRYGKIKSFVTRLMPIGGEAIPYKIIFQDNIEETGTIVFQDGREDSIETMVTKTTAGQILRIELGPTEFDFHRYYVRVKAALSGRDTEMAWIDLE